MDGENRMRFDSLTGQVSELWAKLAAERTSHAETQAALEADLLDVRADLAAERGVKVRLEGSSSRWKRACKAMQTERDEARGLAGRYLRVLSSNEPHGYPSELPWKRGEG